jgi:hypothetical protein
MLPFVTRNRIEGNSPSGNVAANGHAISWSVGTSDDVA